MSIISAWLHSALLISFQINTVLLLWSLGYYYMADLICERASEVNSVSWLAILDCKMGSALLARLVFPALIPQEKDPLWADVTKTGSGEGQKLYLNSSPLALPFFILPGPFPDLVTSLFGYILNLLLTRSVKISRWILVSFFLLFIDFHFLSVH